MQRPGLSRIVRSIIVVAGLISFSSSAIADANNGEFLGFRLGERYKVPRGSVGKTHITGAIIYAVDPEDRHQHVGSLSLYVSPKSSTIGSIFGGWYFTNKRSAQAFADHYLKMLEQRYGHWKRRRSFFTNNDYQLWVDLEEKPPIYDHWPSERNFRVAVALIFAPDSPPRVEWLTKIRTESLAASR